VVYGSIPLVCPEEICAKSERLALSGVTETRGWMIP
jgi:hypothetical protein